MMALLTSVISFIVALGVLVTVHEFGHFWVARKFGVKVLRFSVGFGKPLFTFRRNNDSTEYVLAGIPLGGYVKMLDESEGAVEEHEKHLAFNNKPLFSRFLIVLAGPVFNLLFAFFAFFAILTIGEDGLKPVIGGMTESGIAIHSDIEIGDEILAVNDRPTGIWRVAVGLMASELLDTGHVELTVAKTGGQVKKVVLSFPANLLPEPNEVVDRIGIEPLLPKIKPIIGTVIDGEAGHKAGLKQGDLIVSVNQKAIETWREWVSLIRTNHNKSISIQVIRNNDILQMSVTPKEITENGEVIGRIGVSPIVDENIARDFYSSYSLSGFSAMTEAATQTINYSLLTFKLIGRMIVGEASVQNLSGPIRLAQYAGKTASIGLVPFLNFLAFLSISLGVINLLPIPMLDGGHLFFYLIEAVKGKPVSDKAQGVFMRFGMFVLLSIMLLAVFIDLSRLLG